MNNRLYILIFCCLLAPLPAAAEDYRIGVVDLLRILEQAPQADAARKKIETEFSARETELAELQKELVDAEERIAKDRDVLSESELRELERSIVTKRRAVKRMQDEYREDLGYRRNEELAKLQNLIRESIQSLAKEKNYDLVLGEGLIYVSPKIDMTEDVIAKLRSQEEESTKAEE